MFATLLAANLSLVNKLLATKARNSLWLQFFVMGFVSMAWVPRIPEIKTANGLSDTEFGLVLIASSIGAVMGAQLSGRAIHRFGSRPVFYVSQVVVPSGVVLMGLSATPLLLVTGLFVMGVGYAALDVAGNAQAVAIENHLNKRYITSFHGMWSIGTLATTLVGAGLAFFISPRDNLLWIAGVGLIVFLISSRYLLAPDLDNHSGEEDTKSSMPWFGKLAWPVWILGIGATGTFIAEGAAADWAALLLRDEMGVEIGYYASAFATFALAMILSRFLGDRWLERFGPYQVVRFLGVVGGSLWGSLMLIGIWVSGDLPLLGIVLVNTGFFFAGIAVGPIFPAFILGAANLKGIAPSVGIARIGVISIGAYFVGPTIVGVLSDQITLTYAMLYPVLFLILAGYLARALKGTKTN